MRPQLRILVVAIALVAGMGPSLSARADDSPATLALRLSDAVEEAARLSDLSQVPGDLLVRFQASVAEVRATAVRSQQEDSLTTAPQSLRTIARARMLRPNWFGNDFTNPASVSGQVRFLLDFYGSFLGPELFQRADTATARRLERQVDAFRHVDLQTAHEKTLERIRHFEIKYGPGSAKLNLLETVLNSLAQRSPPFKPGPNGPSPLEVVAAYSTSYGTVVEGKGVAMSAAEFGLRIYNFGYNPDAKQSMALLTPRYWTVGVAVGPDRDGALRWPWEGKPRLGPLVSWGELKLAYLFANRRDDWRIILSRQLHLLPHVL